MKWDKGGGLRDGVWEAYSAAARRPEGKHPFPVGRSFAESLDYPPDVLSGIPAASIGAFCGVSNVPIFAVIPLGATVLDLGCGAGMDSLIAARRVGPSGKVIGVDFSEAMLSRAREGAAQSGAGNVEFRQADAEELPLADDSIDVALVNGVFNLNPARDVIFRELTRVVRPGGEVYAAEIILRQPRDSGDAASREPPKVPSSPADWFA